MMETNEKNVSEIKPLLSIDELLNWKPNPIFKPSQSNVRRFGS